MAELESMLTLAAISYCGYNLTLPEPIKSAHLRNAMTKLLNTLSPVKDQWSIVWGPATFSAASPGFDDAAMYVARKLPFDRKPPTYAIAVRGTNPISLMDWIFGDLLVTRGVPWSYGKESAGANISLSTSLELKVLQHLRWEESAATVAVEHQGTIPDSPGAWMRAIRARLSSDPVTEMVHAVEEDRHLPDLSDADLQSVFRRIEAQSNSPGLDLRSFLKQQVTSSPHGIDVYVTGHSKGGALSSTLALWLADTQGKDVPPNEQWDEHSVASINAYSFAGPTAGNSAFASHSMAILNDCLHRVVNTKDVVPYAWNVANLKLVPTLYNFSTVERLVLEAAVERIAAEVGPVGYTQPGDATRLVPKELPRRPLLAQLIHQHFDAYFEETGLSGEMNLATFFKPVI